MELKSKCYERQFLQQLFKEMYEVAKKYEKNSDKYKVDISIINQLEITFLPEGYKQVYDICNSMRDIITEGYLKLKGTAQKVRVKLVDTSDKSYIAIKIYEPSSQVHYYIPQDTQDSSEYYLVTNNSKKDIIIYSDKAVYVGKNGKDTNRYYPAALNDLCGCPNELLEHILLLYSNESLLWKELMAERFFPPIKLNELGSYHNKKEYFEKKFGTKLPNSVNKKPFIKVYAACCAVKFVLPEQVPFLFNAKEIIDFTFYPSLRKQKEIAFQYLKWYVLKERKVSIDENTLLDYFNFAVSLNEPIDILAGKRKMRRYHDQLANRMVKKANRGKKLIVPETPLKHLRLSRKFTLLNTKSALIFEGERNHNCVGGYIDLVNRGRCIIYTADIDGEHLTIEIRYKKLGETYKIYVRQCYKAFNQRCKEETLKYVEKCVADASENAVKDYIRKQNKKIST